MWISGQDLLEAVSEPSYFLIRNEHVVDTTCSLFSTHICVENTHPFVSSQFNPLTPKISLVILLTVCDSTLLILLLRIWYWIK